MQLSTKSIVNFLKSIDLIKFSLEYNFKNISHSISAVEIFIDSIDFLRPMVSNQWLSKNLVTFSIIIKGKRASCRSHTQGGSLKIKSYREFLSLHNEV